MQRIAGKWPEFSSAFLAVTLIFLFGGCGGKTEPTFNISGSWYMFHTTDGTAGEQGLGLFSFTQSDNDLSGSVATTGESISGSVSGLDVSFSWTDSATSARIDYNGKVSTDGTTMSGTWSDSNGQHGTWNAIIQLNPVGDVQGDWNLLAPVAGVQGFTFVQATNDLTGSVTSQGDQITGILSNPDIFFYWTGSDGVTNTFIGTINNVSGGTAYDMSGSWSDSSGGSGSWSATKGG
jgi:hypothetical protein